jgi:hypothetical protein
MHRDESEMDGTLANTLRTLKTIHHEFFNGQRGKVSHHSLISRHTKLGDCEDALKCVKCEFLSNLVGRSCFHV